MNGLCAPLLLPPPLPPLTIYVPPPQLPLAMQEALREEMWQATDKWRGIHGHEYAGYSGPWIEAQWIEHFSSVPQEGFGGLIPIFGQWVDGVNSAHLDFSNLLETLANLIKPGVGYVTVSQHDRGILHSVQDKVLSV